MNSTLHLSSDASVTDFQDFVLGLGLALEVDELLLHQGVHQLDTPVAELNYAYDAEKRFLAAQWRAVVDGVESAVEAFFVHPKGQTPFTGASVRSWSMSPTRGPTEPAEGLLEWWRTAMPQTKVRTAPFASYARFSALLAQSEVTVTGFPELANRVADLEQETDALNQTARLQSAENKELRRQIHALKDRAEHWRGLAGAPSEPEITSEAKYTRYDQLAEFTKEFADKIVIHPRFANQLKKATYNQPEDVFSALTFLATTYRECRTGQLTGNVMHKAAEIYLGLTRSSGSTTLGLTGDAYIVEYNGRRERLEWHLKKGSDRDPAVCMRVYFFWDPVAEVAVVGSGPAHLRNTIG